MIIGLCSIELRLDWSNSLKDKRSEIKSLIAKIRSKFNASVSEVDAQDEWRRAVLGLAVVTTESRHADTMINEIVSYVERNTEGEVISVHTEIL